MDMLEDKNTLQFILDTVYKIGGEPENIETVLQGNYRKDIVSLCYTLTLTANGQQANGGTEQHVRERIEALTLDANLKRETARASLLIEELQKNSLTKSHYKAAGAVCSYLALCEQYKDHLVIKHSLIALSPENAVCFCEKCAAGKPMVRIAGSPPQQYSLPLGWCQFIHK